MVACAAGLYGDAVCGSFRFPWHLATGFVNVVPIAFLDDSTRNVEESLDVLLKV